VSKINHKLFLVANLTVTKNLPSKIQFLQFKIPWLRLFGKVIKIKLK